MGVKDRINDRISLLAKKRARIEEEYQKEVSRLDKELALLQQAEVAVTPQIERLIDQLNVVLTN